jgi:hypothetical protein
MIRGTTALSLNLPPLHFFLSFVKNVYAVVFWVVTQCSLCLLDSEFLGLTGSVYCCSIIGVSRMICDCRLRGRCIRQSGRWLPTVKVLEVLFYVMTCSLMDRSVNISLVVYGVIMSCSSVVGYQRQKFGICSGDPVYGRLSR